jgi:hypothetical protein
MSATESVTMQPPCSGAAEARALLDLWRAMSATHVSLGANCACGMGGVTLQLSDFEQDIVEFVLGHAERTRRDDVTRFVHAHARNVATGGWNVAVLLTAVAAAREQQTDTAVCEFVLEKLGKTLRSFARLHGTPVS